MEHVAKLGDNSPSELRYLEVKKEIDMPAWPAGQLAAHQVVMMTSKVHAKMEILTLLRSETRNNIETKIGMDDYVMDPCNLAIFCWNWSNGVCLPILVKYNLLVTFLCTFPLLSFPFLIFLSSPTAKTGGRIFTMYTSDHVN